MEIYNNLKIFRYEDPKENIVNVKEPVIFLAGPTVRGHQPHLTSWRFEAIELFKEKNFEGTLVVPEFTSKTESDKGKKWVPLWEFSGLKRADCILFWIPRTRELIGLTTNWEHGYWMGRHMAKLVYGRPDDAYRIGYLDIMWEAILEDKYKDIVGMQRTIHNTLSATIDNSMLLAKWMYNEEYLGKKSE